MKALYTIGIYLYTLGVRAASLFNVKARQMVKGWRNSKKIMREYHAAPARPLAWFHASSLGEFEQARPVLEQFRQKHPKYKVLLTFFSPSGYEVRKNYANADLILYLPMDTPHNAKAWIKRFNPSVVFFVKYDFWFNYLTSLKKVGAKVYLFSSIFRPTQYFFQWYGGWFCRCLCECYTQIFVQNEQSKALLGGIGMERCTVAGDTRFDRVHQIAQTAKTFPEVERFIKSRQGDGTPKVLMAGSSWEPDEEYIKQYLNHNGDIKVILAPHVIAESHIEHIISLFGHDNCVRYSQLANGPASDFGKRVLIIDNIGMLSSLYRYAHVAYIGGAWGRGLHNTLEAITFGKPVVFGPKYGKFQEAKDIVAMGGGFSYADYPTLQHVLDTLFNDTQAYAQASQTCLSYLNDNLGSTDIILSHVNIKLQ